MQAIGVDRAMEAAAVIHLEDVRRAIKVGNFINS